MDLTRQIAKELQVSEKRVANGVKLLDEGNTIPFIARYRKEVTGELNEEELRLIQERLTYLRNLESRKKEVLKAIEEQEKLTPELAGAITQAVKLQEVEDLYRPYKPKRRTRAMIAKELGLEPLAEVLWSQSNESEPLEMILQKYILPEKGVPDSQAALAGSMDIIAERVAEEPLYRKIIRELIWETGVLVSKAKVKEVQTDKSQENGASGTYQAYFDYRELLKQIPPHRVLALNRGEQEGILKVGLEVAVDEAVHLLQKQIVSNPQATFISYLEAAISDGFQRLLLPSLEREVRSELTENAAEHAIKIFGLNLRNLLLQAPVKNLRVMGIDPGYRTGCKVAVVDETGKLLETETIYPHPPQNYYQKSLASLTALIDKYQVQLLAIGNGTASRETELLAAELIRACGREQTAYCIVSEAGASVYSASKIAKEEFPDLDVSLRGAVSIARRIQDPLAELVKIDPKSIGVGLYQHDVNQKRLNEALGGVVESSVNYVGVDLNTASPALLQYVAGLQPNVAKSIAAMRNEKGVFTNRRQLMAVKRLGEQAFTQAAGFLRIMEGDEPLDATSVHPESYPATRTLLQELGFESQHLRQKEELGLLRKKLATVAISQMAVKLGLGEPTLKDIIEALQKPGRDPRENLPGPVFRNDVLSLEDLQPGMALTGTVRNVVDFGAFVDIGVKQDGLVHISELSDHFVKNPTDHVAVGDIVEVKVLAVDLGRKRVSLSMKGSK